MSTPAVPPALARRLAGMLAGNLRREYPSQVSHRLFDDGDVRPPRQLTPVFFGCYDWHSAVHSHWALARLRGAGAEPRAIADAALASSITEAGVAGELAYLQRRAAFERPYGLAWLLVLATELRAGAPALATTLAPLEALAATRLVAWARELPAPIRSGEHAQSAFALGLALDWARATGDGDAAAAITAAAERLHGDERDAPLHWEPSAHDFLSPALGAAALMARVRPPARLAAWLDGFAPTLGRGAALAPPAARDRGDGKLVHWDGLALSRAWMLAELAAALPDDDPRRAALAAHAAAHGTAGVAALDDMSYAGAHWLPTFAIYWLAGAAAAPPR